MKTKHLEIDGHGDLVEELLTTIEGEVESDIFTLRVLSEKKDEILELVVVFENKQVALLGIEFYELDGKLAARVKGDFL
jgi:hypothetical protein